MVDPSDPAKAMSKETHRQFMRAAIDNSHIITEKVVHLTRGCSARMAHEGGASIEEIKMHGLWSTGACERFYLRHINKPVVKVLAGFDAQRNNYHIQRALAEPPLELQEMVFPAFNEAIRKFETNDQRGMEHCQYLQFIF